MKITVTKKGKSFIILGSKSILEDNVLPKEILPEFLSMAEEKQILFVKYQHDAYMLHQMVAALEAVEEIEGGEREKESGYVAEVEKELLSTKRDFLKENPDGKFLVEYIESQL